MPGPIKLATIECAACSTCIDVYGAYELDAVTLSWDTRDEAPACAHPPLTRCPRARAEIKLRYPDLAGGAD